MDGIKAVDGINGWNKVIKDGMDALLCSSEGKARAR